MTDKELDLPRQDKQEFVESPEGGLSDRTANPAGDKSLALRLRAIVDSTPDPILSTDREGNIVTWNEAAQSLFGYRPDEVIGVSNLLLIPPSYHDEIGKIQARVLGGERIDNLHSQMLRKGGGRVDITASMTPIRDSDGSILGLIKTARDLRAQRQNEDARMRLVAIVNSSIDAIISKDLNGMVTTWNAAAERMFGYSSEEIVGHSIMTIVPPELQSEELEVMRRVLQGEPVEHFETERLRQGGSRIDVALTMSPIRNSSGEIIGASQIVRDISERRRTEETRMRLAAIVESSDDAIISKDLDGIITSWNSGAKRIFGYEADEIVGHSVMRLIPRELHAEEPMILARLRAGQRVEHFESKRRRKNGELIDVSLTVSPIKDSTGKVIGASKIAREITERKRAEAALIEKEKLAATGRMAAAIAHEVNNPLESIMNLAYLLTHDPGLSEKASYYASLLLQEVERASEITRRTLSFYRNPTLPGEVNIAQLLETILRGKRQRVSEKGITIHRQVEGEGKAWGLAGELGQVLSNLLENAIDAVDQDGEIIVRTRDLNDSGNILISVCDNGTGMSATTAERIFEPFFTTKNSRGSGLGLWVTRGIVEKHNGSLRLRTSQSARHHGTIFSVILPRPTAKHNDEETALSAD
ncbi:MAG TPA: PAS domain S-box protein [Terriglobales bacterium]|nr:PAS domain S-box protein [Terriglobales bacterium]